MCERLLLSSDFNAQTNLLLSGLCHVIRKLIKMTYEEKDNSLKSLLGHKQCCLKASSEVSSRTKLCEVKAPIVNDIWLKTASKDELGELPEAVNELEGIFQQPVVIHNMDKFQRVVLDRMNSERSGTSEPPCKLKRSNFKKVVKTNDLPPLEHTFVEGIDFTLSDLALLPLVHNFLKFYKEHLDVVVSLIPLTVKWYGRIQKIPHVVAAFKMCNFDFVDISGHLNEISPVFEEGKCQVIELGDKGKVKPNKKPLEKTLRRDLPVIVEKMNASIEVAFQQYDPMDIKVDWSGVPEQVHPTMGELSTARALRKCQQMENLIFSVNKICKDGDVIVDFCCGGGHVGILLAHFLPQCQIVLVENKEESLDRARVRIENLGLKNIIIYQCNLEHYSGHFNIGVALHACGVASDMVLHKCFHHKASFVVSPCCYGRIVNTDKVAYPQSEVFRSYSVSFDEMLAIGRGGDQTSWNFDSSKAKQGKHCMGIIDTDRLNSAKELGYQTELYTLQPPTCSPKNNLLVGVKT